MRALVLLPTRELADQVAAAGQAYAKYTNLRSAVVFGGMDMKPQTAELKNGVEVLVATPGRLLDHIEAKNACSTRSNTWCSTRPTACWTSASCPTCSAS